VSKRVQANGKIFPETAEQLDAHCERTGTNKSEFIRKAIEKALLDATGQPEGGEEEKLLRRIREEVAVAVVLVLSCLGIGRTKSTDDAIRVVREAYLTLDLHRDVLEAEAAGVSA